MDRGTTDVRQILQARIRAELLQQVLRVSVMHSTPSERDSGKAAVAQPTEGRFTCRSWIATRALEGARNLARHAQTPRISFSTGFRAHELELGIVHLNLVGLAGALRCCHRYGGVRDPTNGRPDATVASPFVNGHGNERARRRGLSIKLCCERGSSAASLIDLTAGVRVHSKLWRQHVRCVHA